MGKRKFLRKGALIQCVVSAVFCVYVGVAYIATLWSQDYLKYAVAQWERPMI